MEGEKKVPFSALKVMQYLKKRPICSYSPEERLLLKKKRDGL